MQDLTLLKTSIAFNTTITKLTMSLDDIKKNNPNRLDLINSMSETLADIEYTKRAFKDLEENWRIECKTSFRMAQNNVVLQTEVNKLQDEIIDLNREL